MRITWLQQANSLAARQKPERLRDMILKTLYSLERDSFPVPKIRKNADKTVTVFLRIKIENCYCCLIT
jgi:hypothetical protein